MGTGLAGLRDIKSQSPRAVTTPLQEVWRQCGDWLELLLTS